MESLARSLNIAAPRLICIAGRSLAARRNAATLTEEWLSTHTSLNPTVTPLDPLDELAQVAYSVNLPIACWHDNTGRFPVIYKRGHIYHVGVMLADGSVMEHSVHVIHSVYSTAHTTCADAVVAAVGTARHVFVCGDTHTIVPNTKLPFGKQSVGIPKTQWQFWTSVPIASLVEQTVDPILSHLFALVKCAQDHDLHFLFGNSNYIQSTASLRTAEPIVDCPKFEALEAVGAVLSTATGGVGNDTDSRAPA